MKKYSNTDKVVVNAEKSLLKSYKIGIEMIKNLDDQDNWRDITVVTKESILQIYDAIFEFIYPEDNS